MHSIVVGSEMGRRTYEWLYMWQQCLRAERAIVLENPQVISGARNDYLCFKA